MILHGIPGLLPRVLLSGRQEQRFLCHMTSTFLTLHRNVRIHSLQNYCFSVHTLRIYILNYVRNTYSRQALCSGPGHRRGVCRLGNEPRLVFSHTHPAFWWGGLASRQNGHLHQVLTLQSDRIFFNRTMEKINTIYVGGNGSLRMGVVASL